MGQTKENGPKMVKKAMVAVEAWCNSRKGRPLGGGELSQAFIHLTGAILKEGGRAGLLVSSGVLFRHHKNSREFRNVWLQSVQLEHIVNFGHVRRVFFSGKQRNSKGVSPFISAVFKKTENISPENRFQYWSAKTDCGGGEYPLGCAEPRRHALAFPNATASNMRSSGKSTGGAGTGMKRWSGLLRDSQH